MPVISLDEYANLPKGVSSEERLEHFSSGNWSPQLFFRKAMTFPRFHRHLHKWENDEIGGQHEHRRPRRFIYGDV
jgi:hypothetical protein